MKNKKCLLFVFSLLIGLLFNTRVVRALDEPECDKSTAMNIAKIVYHEVGRGDSAYVNPDEAFYTELVTASVVLNNVSVNSGSTLSDKMWNVNSIINFYPCFGGDERFNNKCDTWEYNYRSKDYNSFVSKEKQGELLYVAELVLSGKFNTPRNLHSQAAKGVVIVNGHTIWDYVKFKSPYDDEYFGYGRYSPDTDELATVDVFGRTLPNTDPGYYRSLAESFKNAVDYSKYNSDTVCSGISNNINGKSNYTGKKKNVYVDVPACENPEILRVIYFASIIVDIVKIIIPIGLVIMAMVDFSKGVSSNNDSDNKKNFSKLIKRFVYAILIFAVPWIVKIVIINLGSLTKDVNYIDCLKNATEEGIKEKQERYDELVRMAEME